MGVKSSRVVVADTNIVSYFLKGDLIALEYKRLLVTYTVHIAFVTIAELSYWAEKNGWGARRRLHLRNQLMGLPVLPCNEGVSEEFARLRIHRERAGRPMASADGWIAATAIHFDVPLATHDRNFLETPGLRVISANPEVCLIRDRYVESRRTAALDMRCGCSL